jgi:trigger factor
VKVTIEKTEKRQAYLTIEMEPAEMEEGLNKAYARLVQKYAVPGFRKGKTPRPILEQYLGKEALIEDAVDHMAPEAFQKAVKENDLKPIAQPQVELEKLEPVTYKMVVPLEPAVKMGDYNTIKMTPEKAELKDEEVERAIENLRHQHADWVPVDRQVNSRDTVTLDIESMVGDKPYINQKDAQFQVEKESEFPIKGFSEQLIGMQKDETKEFKLNFPADDSRTEMAGKEVSFKVTIKETKQEKLPEVNDEFAQKVGAEFKTADELREKVRENLKAAIENQVKANFEQKVVDELVKISEIEYPQIMEEEEIDSLIRQQMQRWQVDEKGMDEYLKSIQKTPEQMREEFRPVAARSLKQMLVLTEAAKKEDIKVERADLKTEIENMTRDIQEDRKEKLVEILNHPRSQASIASTIATRRIVDRLTVIAQSAADDKEKSEQAEAKPAEATQEEAKQ